MNNNNNNNNNNNKRRKIFYLHLDRFLLIIQGKLEIQGWPQDIKFISFEPSF